ncbi:MAG TPA: HEPN domain-containing protein [Phycisphaerae bacterium]|nr:HEPN domain-containing protein [Phycisphaerae bacterium]
MVDVDKQVAYWRDGASEDMAVARELLASGHARHALFLAHLALEKVLKAYVCRATRDVAPRIHSLLTLSRLAGLNVDEDMEMVLTEMTRFNLEGRYPGYTAPPPTIEEATAYFDRAQEVFEWLMQQL